MNTSSHNVLSWLPLAGAALLVVPAPGFAAESIISSKHNLSSSGPGQIKAVSETEICIFCHTPHKGTGQTPLWSHALSEANYTPYHSSTIKATVGQPNGASKLCLSCHDGTVALGMITARASAIDMRSGVTTLPPGRSRLGTDLSDDHPVSFTFDQALASANGQLKSPASLTDKVRLDHNNQMQCTSCHDPHNNQYGSFLVQANVGSALCISCHDMTQWQNASHRISNRTWNGSGINPWPHTDRSTVAANACENCHTSHNAGTPARLLTFVDEEQNCYSCHNGNVATHNLQSEFLKPSVHPILSTTRVHDPAEEAISASRHVECADCHNPHASSSMPALAPNASGALAGLMGVNKDGTMVKPLSREYELCYRCHADSVNRGSAQVPRQFVQTNTRLEFAAANASFHPVETVGRNQNVPSLLQPWNTASRMYCTDCHNNDQGTQAGGSGPNGPHGSAFPPILEKRLALVDYEIENSGTYALCYKCHNRSSLLADESFPHKAHVVDHRTSCVTCHDPHGVQGVTHLINFNSLYVTPASNGRVEFVDTGVFRGNCTLSCHDKDGQPMEHLMREYGAGASLTPLPSRGKSPAPVRRRR